MIRINPIILLTFCLTLGFSSCKSKHEQCEEVLKVQKVAFFTQKLNLTTHEAELFWPVYNDYWKRKNQILESKRSTMKFCAKNLEKMTDEEIIKYANEYVNFQKQESDLLIEFNEKFKQILPPSKVLMLYQTDYDFKTYLLQQIKNSGKK
ncbi:MAG: hypothetical protein HOO91_04395 [Bacteroidales bacterium]|nr:hypothetical protein [Bacteroidales bacterium]